MSGDNDSSLDGIDACISLLDKNSSNLRILVVGMTPHRNDQAQWKDQLKNIMIGLKEFVKRITGRLCP